MLKLDSDEIIMILAVLEDAQVPPELLQTKQGLIDRLHSEFARIVMDRVAEMRR